jgi:hypothetical protein
MAKGVRVSGLISAHPTGPPARCHDVVVSDAGIDLLNFPCGGMPDRRLYASLNRPPPRSLNDNGRSRCPGRGSNPHSPEGPEGFK